MIPHEPLKFFRCRAGSTRFDSDPWHNPPLPGDEESDKTMIRRATAGARAALRFVSQGFTDFDTNASFVPSSRFLVDAMLRPIPLSRSRRVVELGSGTGTLTRELLKRLPKEAELCAIELDEKLLRASIDRFNDRRLRGVHGNAVDLPALLPQHWVGRVDAVVSSLGLSLMEPADRDAVMSAASAVLSTEGVFTQYAYAHARWVAYSQSRKEWFNWHARPYLETRFRSVRSTFVPLNVPPAWVFVCRK